MKRGFIIWGTLNLYFICTSLSAQELLTLNRAFELAAQHSSDLKKSALSLERSRENLKAQNASLKSDFRLRVTPFSFSNQLKYDDRPGGDGWYNVQQSSSALNFSVSQPILLTDATVGLSNQFKWQDANGDESFYNSLTLRLDQPLFTHNKLKMNLKEVKLEVENAEIAFALRKLSIERSVTSAFYGVYQDQMKLLIYQEEYDNQKLNHKIVVQKVAAGLLPLEELYQSEVNLLTAENTLASAKVNLENAKDAFKMLLGVRFDYDFTTILNLRADSIGVDRALAVERSLEVARELRQKEIDIEIAEFVLLQTIDNNSFSGNLSLQMGFSGQHENLTALYDKSTNNTGVSLSFEVPIWDWGKRRARIRSSKINLERQEIYLADEQREIELAIRKLHRSLNNLYQQISKADKNVRNAQLTYDTNLERFKMGKISGMDLQLIQNQLSSKKMAQTNALINYKLELLNLKIQTLYDWEKCEDFLPEGLFED